MLPHGNIQSPGWVFWPQSGSCPLAGAASCLAEESRSCPKCFIFYHHLKMTLDIMMPMTGIGGSWDWLPSGETWVVPRPSPRCQDESIRPCAALQALINIYL